MATTNINEALTQIRSAVYGKDVRGAIADGIQIVYDDAGKVGNANMEVTMARGNKSTLSQRLTADNEYLDNKITKIGNGGPKGVFVKYDALVNTFPNGNDYIYLVSEDGNWYFWNGLKWIPGGKYQATALDNYAAKTENIAVDAIAPFDMSVSETINVFNKLDHIPDTIVNNSGMFVDTPGYKCSHLIPVQPGETYAVTYQYSSQGGFYDDFENWIGKVNTGIELPGGGYKITVPEGAVYMRLNMGSVSTFMAVKGNKHPQKYYEYGERRVIPWLDPNIKSLPDKVVSPENMFTNQQINLFDVSTAADEVIDGKGNITASTNIVLSQFIKVIPGQKYTAGIKYASPGGMYDKDKNWVGQLPVAAGGTEWKPVTYQIPGNVHYVRLNAVRSDNVYKFMFVPGDKYPSTYSSYGVNVPWVKLDNTVTTLPRQTVSPENIFGAKDMNIFNRRTVSEKTIINNVGTISEHQSVCLSDYIKVIGGRTYTASIGYSSQGGIYDKNLKYIGDIPHPADTVKVPTSFTLPENAAYIRINVAYSDNVDKFMLVPGDLGYYPSEFIGYGANIPWLRPKSRWAYKKWGVVGDSITEKNFRAYDNYHDFIAREINCLVTNYGISGTGWRTPSGSGRDPIYKRVAGMADDLDLITVFAGTNDWGQTGITNVLGQFGDTDPAASFYGAVDNTLSQLIAKYPTKTIAVFTPIPRANAFNGIERNGITLDQVCDAIIKVCRKYAIPVLDLYRTAALFPWNETANNTYFMEPGNTSGTGDGLHPNDAGHKLLAAKMLAFLNTL